MLASLELHQLYPKADAAPHRTAESWHMTMSSSTQYTCQHVPAWAWHRPGRSQGAKAWLVTALWKSREVAPNIMRVQAQQVAKPWHSQYLEEVHFKGLKPCSHAVLSCRRQLQGSRAGEVLAARTAAEDDRPVLPQSKPETRHSWPAVGHQRQGASQNAVGQLWQDFAILCPAPIDVAMAAVLRVVFQESSQTG